MDHNTVECGKTSLLGLPGSVAAGASILRRPLRLHVQLASALVVDRDGELHQERLLVPAGTLEDILRALYDQLGLELLALDWPPNETIDADIDFNACGNQISIVIKED